MFIKLTPRAAFWSLVDPLSRKLIVHLTFQDPGPKKINAKGLNAQCKQILEAGLKMGNIMQMKDPKAVAKPKEPAPEIKKKGQEDSRIAQQEMTAEEFLKQGVRGIRDQLRDVPYGSIFLSLAIELEKAGPARKTVLSALEQKLNKVGGTSAVVDKDEEQIEIQLA